MIVRYPTGLYSTVLPSRPEDSGNVTYLISNTTPPRSNLLFPKVPTGIVRKRKPVKEITLIDRRQIFGNMVFSLSKATRKEEGNNVRQYEIGQILEFNDTVDRSVDPMLVGSITEVRHDTNIIDYDIMGLTIEEQQAISKLSTSTQDQLMDKLNDLKQLRGDSEQIINVQQKLINDITKTINSLTVTIENGSVNNATDDIATIEQLINKLSKKRDDAYKIRDKAIDDANKYSQEATEVLDQLRAVGVLVK